MLVATSPTSSTPAPRTALWLAPILFWLFSYALFTWRAYLNPSQGVDALFLLRRLVSTGFGAGLCWLILHRMTAGGRRPDPVLLIASVVPASLLLLALRVTISPLLGDNPPPIGDHVRFVLTWAGYFGLWLCGFAVLTAPRSKTSASVATDEIATEAPATGANAATVEWAMTAIAEELRDFPDANRHALLRRLERRAGYALVDDPTGIENLRAALVERLASKAH